VGLSSNQQHRHFNKKNGRLLFPEQSGLVKPRNMYIVKTNHRNIALAFQEEPIANTPLTGPSLGMQATSNNSMFCTDETVVKNNINNGGLCPLSKRTRQQRTPRVWMCYTYVFQRKLSTPHHSYLCTKKKKCMYTILC